MRQLDEELKKLSAEILLSVKEYLANIGEINTQLVKGLRKAARNVLLVTGQDNLTKYAGILRAIEQLNADQVEVLDAKGTVLGKALRPDVLAMELDYRELVSQLLL